MSVADFCGSPFTSRVPGIIAGMGNPHLVPGDQPDKLGSFFIQFNHHGFIAVVDTRDWHFPGQTVTRHTVQLKQEQSFFEAWQCVCV
jgi:hypothetical protein